MGQGPGHLGNSSAAAPGREGREGGPPGFCVFTIHTSFGGIGVRGKNRGEKNNKHFEHFLDFALYGRWEGLNRPKRLDSSSLAFCRIEFLILRTFCFLSIFECFLNLLPNIFMNIYAYPSITYTYSCVFLLKHTYSIHTNA